MSKLDDIDYLVGLIYEHLYMKIPSRPIESKALSTNYLEDLTIVKKMYTGEQLKELINIIFNTNLSYIGRSEGAFKFKRVNEVSDILLRQYVKGQELDPSNSLNVDKIIAYLLSDLVVHKKTNGIMINICNADIPTKDLEIFTKKYPEIKFSKDSIISVTIREHFFKLVTLKEHLSKENTLENYKSCIFQVLHTLDVIQSMYPTFRHNNLTIDTVLVYQTNEKIMKYKLENKEFIFKSSGETKITNFLNSNIKNYIDNNSLDPKMQEANKYYDVNMFLNSLLELELPKLVQQFVKDMINSTARDILLKNILESDISKNNKSINEQLGGDINEIIGGAKKKKSKSKKHKKLIMSQKEVDEILNVNTPEEETLSFVNRVKNNHNPVFDPEQQIKIDLGSKKYMTAYNQSGISQLPQPPINIPGTNLQLKQPESAEPIIEINVPKPEIPVNSLGSFLGNPSEPSSGIMNSFGANPPTTNWQLQPNAILNRANDLSKPNSNVMIPREPKEHIGKMGIINSGEFNPENASSGSIASNLRRISANRPDSNIPMNIIPNPSLMENIGAHSILGDPRQKGGSTLKLVQRAGADTTHNQKAGADGVHNQKAGADGVHNQKAGADRIIPIYKNTSNSPYKSNEQIRTQKERFFEQHPEVAREEKQEKSESKERSYEEPPPRGFNLSKTAFKFDIAPELMPQPFRPPQPAPPENVVKMMNYIIPNTFGPNQMAQPSANVMSQNTYNITFANPSKVREFREDILPSKDESMLKYTMNTITERIIIYQYIRSILIRQSDGENINFLSDKSPEVRNLLSYLRILDVQISKYDKATNNPLGVLPRRVITYSSCYPIRVDRTNYNVGCAKNNIGINIKIYQLIMGETFVNKYRSLPYKAFEVWREISLYEQMRDNIIKSKLSPNFSILYAYYITQDTEIDFLKINRLRNKDIVSKKEKEQKLILNNLYKQEMTNYLVGLQKYSTADLTKLVSELDIHQPSNKCLIALTESGTQDLITWSSRQYEDNGLAKKMINTGYHSYETWLSVLFQMYQGFLSMFKYGIAFQRFDINSNVLVKSLKQDEMNVGYWRYRINGIDFYVPNYGYLTMITPDFADIIDNDEQTLINVPAPVARPALPTGVLGLGVVPNTATIMIDALDNSSLEKLDKTIYKSYSNELLVNQSELNVNKNKLRTISNMKDAFDQNVFNKEYTLNGGVRPDDGIIRIITDVNTSVSTLLTRESAKIRIGEKAEKDSVAAGIKNQDAIARVVSAAVNVVMPLTSDQAIINQIAIERVVPAPVPAPAAPVPFKLQTDELLITVINKFKDFLHNRVGTSLKETEMPNLIEADNLIAGELVCCLDNRRWGIIVNISIIAGVTTYKMFTVDEPAGTDINILNKLQIVDYTIGDLRKSTILVEQVSKPNQKLSDSDLLETYELIL